MLVLLSFGLVLVATVLLVLGLVSDSGGLTLIYLSIASSLVAGVLLFLSYTKLGKKATPAPAPVEATPAAAPAGEPEPESAPEVEATPTPVVDETAFAPEPNPATAATGVVPAVDEPAGDDEFFPIADYDDLTTAQILPLLPELYADEVDVVAEREQAGKARPEVLGRLADLRTQLAGAPADATGSSLAADVVPESPELLAEPAPAPAPAPAKKVPAKKSAAKKAAAPVKKAPVKKAAAKKVVASADAAPAKKAVAKKAAAKKAAAPATKGAAKKVVAPAPAKKATKATKATKKA